MGVIDGGAGARSRFYDDLGIALDAGIDVRSALDTISEYAGLYGRWASNARLEIQGGASLTDALARTGPLPSVDKNLLDAGERSGQLPTILKRLAGRYDETRKRREMLASKLAYPLVVLHLSILLPPLYVFFTDGPLRYLLTVGAGFALIYGALGLGLLAVILVRRQASVRRAFDAMVLRAPLVGDIVWKADAATWGEVLSLLHGAGLPVGESLERSASALSNAVIQEAAHRIAARVAAERCRVSEAMEPDREAFPRLLYESVRSGETAGRLDESVERAARGLREDADRGLRFLAVAIPGVLYGGVAMYVAYVAITFFQRLYAL